MVKAHRPTQRRVFCSSLLLVLLAAAFASAQTQPLPESSVKAALIGRFPEFVEWPASTLTGQAPVTLCLSPSHPFGSKVQQLTKGATVKGRPVAVRELLSGESLGSCHLLYVALADRQVLDRAQQLPILTVGDQPDFCQIGGVVNLRVINGRVRFEVNVKQARHAGLMIDSQLLRLASVLHGSRP